MISLKIYIPKPTTSLSKATYAKSTPSVFFALFDPGGTLPTPPSVTFPDLIKWAIDAGYGAQNGVDQDAFLAIPASDRTRLGDYQRARLTLLMHLLRIDPSTGLYRDTVVRYLESSDKSDAAFILGGIACRFATEAWLTSHSRSLTRFWHYSIYSNTAVCGFNFSVSTLKVAAKKKIPANSATPAAKPSKLDGDRRPDYLVECNRGRWYAVEAKGTFGGFDYSDVKDGMDQARRLRSITFADPVKGGPGALPIRHVIADYACSCAYFDQHDHLNVNFVDPPADATETEDDDDVFDLEMDTTVAELLQFYRTVQQFRNLSSVRPRKLPAMLGRSDHLIRWSEIHFSSERRRIEDRMGLWVGIPIELDSEAMRMRAVLDILAVLSPGLRGLFNEHQAHQSSGTFDRRLLDATQDLQLQFPPASRHVLSRMLGALRSGESAPRSWLEAMQRCRQVQLKPGKREPASIDEIVQSMRDSLKASASVAMTLRFDTSNIEPRTTVRDTAGGLIIVGGEPWEPALLTRRVRKTKI